mmetsp:Transcript_40505/g.90018  ORF Transcript_40505/g.90018 Transcript_40505/m.90018 type:complete len:204 (-) Transcript_40505:2640-3251(-)
MDAAWAAAYSEILVSSRAPRCMRGSAASPRASHWAWLTLTTDQPRASSSLRRAATSPRVTPDSLDAKPSLPTSSTATGLPPHSRATSILTMPSSAAQATMFGAPTISSAAPISCLVRTMRGSARYSSFQTCRAACCTEAGSWATAPDCSCWLACTSSWVSRAWWRLSRVRLPTLPRQEEKHAKASPSIMFMAARAQAVRHSSC